MADTPASGTKTASKESKDAPKEVLAGGDAEAAYVSPDMTFRDGGGESLPDVEQQHVDDLEEATKKEREEAADYEDKVVKQRREDAEKEAKEAEKAEAKASA